MFNPWLVKDHFCIAPQERQSSIPRTYWCRYPLPLQGRRDGRWWINNIRTDSFRKVPSAASPLSPPAAKMSRGWQRHPSRALIKRLPFLHTSEVARLFACTRPARLRTAQVFSGKLLRFYTETMKKMDTDKDEYVFICIKICGN